MNSIAAGRCAAATLAVLVLAAVPDADAASTPRVTSLDAPAAIAGAAVTARGRGLQGKGLKVTVDGKRARVLERASTRLRFVVPAAKPGTRRLVVRRGKRSSTKRIRVLKPFTGRIGARLDARRAKSARVGPGGGTLAAKGADGTRYSLTIPAGALAREETIRIVPVKRFTGVPFTGGRVEGARLLPDGLALAAPAKLTIAGGRRFSARTMGFSFASGPGFEVTGAARRRAAVVLEVGHFSDHAAAEASEADFVNLVQPLVDGPNLSLAEIRSMLNLVAIWDARFGDPEEGCDGLKNECTPPTFCKAQPLCLRAYAKAISSMDALIATACARGRNAPSLAVMRELSALGSDRSLLGGEGDPTIACIHAVGRAMTDAAVAALNANPLAASAGADQLPSADRDADGRVTTFEYALALAPVMAQAGVPRADADLLAAVEAAFGKILADGIALCAADRAAGARNLRIGLGYVAGAKRPPEAFIAALAACGVEILVLPLTAEVARGEQKQFEVTLTSTEARDEGLEGVTWTATGGTISPSGLFTAPDATGVFEIRATSNLNPQRSATARVTVVEPAASCTGAPAPRLARAAARRGAPVVQPGDVVLRTPADVEAFRAAGITEVTGTVTVGGPGAPSTLEDLAGLEQLTRIGEGFSVVANRDLESLDGLCGLSSVGGVVDVDGNPALTSLSGLSGLATAGGLSIARNDALTKLDGLEALTIVSGDVRAGGPALTSVAGLRNLRTIGRSLAIDSTAGGGSMSTYALPALRDVGLGVAISGEGGPLRTVSLPMLAGAGLGLAGTQPTFNTGLIVRDSDITRVDALQLGDLQRIEATSVDEPLTLALAQRPRVRRGGIAVSGTGPTGSLAIAAGAVDGPIDVSFNAGGAVSIVAATAFSLDVDSNAGGSVAVDVDDVSIGSNEGVGVESNTGLALELDLGKVGGAFQLGGCGDTRRANRGVSLDDLRIGSIDGLIEILGNVGFSDQAAVAWVNPIPKQSAPQVRGNVEEGDPNC